MVAEFITPVFKYTYNAGSVNDILILLMYTYVSVSPKIAFHDLGKLKE